MRVPFKLLIGAVPQARPAVCGGTRMKLQLDMVSVEVLLDLAKAIEEVRDDIGENTTRLYEQYANLAEGLGVHQPDFDQMLSMISKEVSDFEDAVSALAPKMRICADAIYNYIHQDSSDDVPHAMGTRVKAPYSYSKRIENSSSDHIDSHITDDQTNSGIIDIAKFGQPRDLPITQQKMINKAGGGKTYNTPAETGKNLDHNQGKMKGFSGTCGLCSCENVLRLAGVNVSEYDIVQFAAKNGLCVCGWDEDENGGTNYESRKKILEAFGVDSSLLPQNLSTIANAITSGKGVIISVDAGLLWNDARYMNGLHAVTVTSVDFDFEGNIEGFHICDSGAGIYDMVVSGDKLENCLAVNRKMNVTQQIIR